MATVARIKKDGTFLVKDTINERLPVVTEGLVAHYPLDSSAGAIDVVSGNGTNQNLESGVNIVDCLNTSWKNPANWDAGSPVWDEVEQAMKFTVSSWTALQVYIPIVTSKAWYIEATVKEGSGATGTFYLGTISYDASFNVLPGHPGTYDYFGAVGYDIGTSWVTYKNTAISGAPRTGETSDANYATWHTGTKYAKILLRTNYSGGVGPTWLKNLKFYTTTSNTSNCTLTEDGVGIEEPTTNYVSNPNNFSSGWNSYGNGNDGACLTDLGTQGLQLINRQSWCGAYKYITAPAGTYTLSVWVKLIGRTNSDVQVGLYTSGGGISDTVTSADWSKQEEWQRISMTRTYTADNFILFLICYGGLNDPAYKVSCIYTKPQIELRGFSTSYVVGSHAQSNLFLPIGNILNNTNCTINFDYYKEYGISNTIISGSIIQNNPPNGKWWGLYHNGNGAVYSHWLNGEYTSGFHTQAQYTWANYTICWDASKEYIYVNGELKAEKAKSADLATNQLPTITLGWGWTAGNGKFKNFKIYNRTLSVTEINQLCKEGLKVQATKTTALKFIEAPIIPLDSYYYPLATDTKDSSKSVDAYTKTNVVHEDGSVWVGTAVTNYATSWTGSQRPNSTYLGLKNGVDCWKFTSGAWSSTWSGNSFGYMSVYSATQPAGTPFTFSFKEYISNDSNSVGWFNVEGAGVGGGISGGNYLSSSFRPKIIQRSLTSTWVNTDGATFLVYPLILGNTVGAFSGYHLIWRPQVELSSFRTPVANMYRGDTHLTYNFNSSIGLDWSGNWSICYWKKPIATFNNTMTAYNIESVGCNSNAVGGGYWWFGKNYGENTIFWGGSADNPYGILGAITPSTYFNNWHFVALRKNGTSITMTMKGLDFNYEVSISATISASNRFVTQYGYDFKLSGWDNSSPCNAYFRDLIVVKRALSDSELTSIYKQFRITKTSNNSDFLIEEGLS